MGVVRMSRYLGLCMVGMLLAVALASVSAPASAQGRAERCQDYARDAVDQADKNDRNRCGYTG